MAYYNTTHEKGELLERLGISTEKQDVLIFTLFNRDKESIFTPFDIQELLLSEFKRDFPITSIRRSINTLTNIDALRKTSIKRKGRYGKNNYCWTLNKGEKHGN